MAVGMKQKEIMEKGRGGDEDIRIRDAFTAATQPEGKLSRLLPFPIPTANLMEGL